MPMKTITIPYRPRYPEVHRILESRRFVVLVAHRRFGKTTLAMNHLLKMALTCRRPQGMFGYVGPFRNQAKSVAWNILKSCSSGVPGREINESELFVSLPGPEGSVRIRIFGADNPDALRGLYFDGVVMDEVAQIRPSTWEEVIRPALADRAGWALFIGTPKGINLFSELYHKAQSLQSAGDTNWAALRFPVTDTDALPPEEVERLRREQSDNIFRQEMLCDFTVSTDDTLISIEEADAAMNRQADPALAEVWPLVVGVDVARFGEDATVFFPRRGLYALEPVVLRKLSNVEVAHRLVAFIAERDPALVCVDQGQGTGVIDLARELTAARGTVIVEVPFGGRANRDAVYANRRAEMWTNLRDWLRAGGRLPRNEALRAELAAPCYDFDAAGRIRLEAKENIKTRLKRSTDLADALALTFAVPSGPPEQAFPNLHSRYGATAAHHVRHWIRNPQPRLPYNPFA